MNVSKTCPSCKQTYVPELADDVEAFSLWRNGTLIQHAFPDATPAQREQLLTGVCSDKCWDELVGTPNFDITDAELLTGEQP